MKDFLKIAFRAVLTFAVLAGVQYLIPWYLITGAAIVAGVFMFGTSDDRPTALGILIGGIGFGVFAYFMAKIFPVAG